MSVKSEIRNPKSEGNPKLEIRVPPATASFPYHAGPALTFRPLRHLLPDVPIGFPSSVFGFRI